MSTFSSVILIQFLPYWKMNSPRFVTGYEVNVSYFVNREVSNEKHANNVCYISESYVNSRKCVASQKILP